ncbi:predicted protein [Naegleria gruberi]|uniref:Predicted protein n=1 Tax=Naegleria gruberi TaxID=5762 RepID=D2V6K3_NAEGR|nr:uncharacterized protein NAEGRDRAFT_64469 [Naegleria gruberi]EFC47594.1 predicted protein [Naegleria gruberi]|eukprot:XP_002680338.1 predicted protein [Naegleria gruberi strain NEG-M]
MTKVAPSGSEYEEQTTPSVVAIKEPLNPKTQPRTCCTGIIPLNLFIVSIISVMILSGCLLVWLSSYLVTEKAINDLSTKLINESGRKIITYLDGVMTPIAKLTKTMAREYTTGVVTIPMFRNYLFPKFVEFRTTGCGFFFSVPLPSRYTYTISGTTSNPFPVFAYQPFGYEGNMYPCYPANAGLKGFCQM